MKWLFTLLAGAAFGAAAMFYYLYRLDDRAALVVPTSAISGAALAYPPAPAPK